MPKLLFGVSAICIFNLCICILLFITSAKVSRKFVVKKSQQESGTVFVLLAPAAIAVCFFIKIIGDESYQASKVYL